MLSRLAFRLAGRLWAVLLVLTIAVHAGAPVAAAPLDWRSGSAFSANTVEVAVAPARSQITVRIAAPLPRAVVPIMAAPSNRPAFLFPATPARPDSTGPPVREPACARPAAPRAPPLT
jgi:hypothetical protein